MDAKTAFAKLRDEAKCQLMPPAEGFAGVAMLLRQLLQVTVKHNSETGLRSFMEAAACYYDGRSTDLILELNSNLQKAIETTMEAAERVEQVAEEAANRLDTATVATNELQERLQKSLTELTAVIAETKEDRKAENRRQSSEEGEIPQNEDRTAAYTHSPSPLPSSTGMPRSYAAATAQSVAEHILRPTHAATIARGDVSAKQIVIRLDPTKAAAGDTLANLTDDEVVQKAQVALDLITGTGTRPEKMAFAVARRQPGGKVLLQLNSAEAAQWLRHPGTLQEFEGHFGGAYLVKPRAFGVIAEFVPISLDLDEPEIFRHAEEINELQPQEIIGGRWLRAPERRTPGQKKAFIAIGCRTRAGANKLIQDGLLLNGRLIQARRTKPEPLRCAKCQRLNPNHVARTCTSPHDVCALCSGQHRTSSCAAKDPNTVCCANCHGQHAASDRTCPEFEKKVLQMRERTPDSAYVYFPTNEPWTWVKHEEMAVVINHRTRPAQGPPPTRKTPRRHDPTMPPPFYASRANRIPLGKVQAKLDTWLPMGMTADSIAEPSYSDLHTILGQTPPPMSTQ